jgi:hypothetical protein
MQDLGILLLGVGAIVMGGYHVTRRRYVALNEIGAVIGTYRGAAVVCQGLSEVCIGVGVFCIGLVRMLGKDDAAGAWLATRPWPLFLCGSLAAFFFGGFMVFGSEEQRRSRGTLMLSLPGRLLGMIVIVLSLGGLALGVLDLVAPTQFQRGVDGLRRSLTPRARQSGDRSGTRGGPGDSWRGAPRRSAPTTPPHKQRDLSAGR